MKGDVQAKMRGDGFNLAYWTEAKTRETQPLEMIHIVASTLILFGGLVFAVIAFLGEKLTHKLKMKT